MPLSDDEFAAKLNHDDIKSWLDKMGIKSYRINVKNEVYNI